MTKQWFTPRPPATLGEILYIVQNSNRVTHREYGSIPWAIPPIEIPSGVESMPGVGWQKYCAAVDAHVAGEIGYSEMKSRI